MLEKYFPQNKEKTQKRVRGDNPQQQKQSCVHPRTNRNFFPHFTENEKEKHSCLKSWNEVFLRNSSRNHIVSSTQPAVTVKHDATYSRFDNKLDQPHLKVSGVRHSFNKRNEYNLKALSEIHLKFRIENNFGKLIPVCSLVYFTQFMFSFNQP